jgi:hypothetical protein
MDGDKATALIFGNKRIESKTDLRGILAKYKLGDIMEPKRVKDHELQTIASLFNSKYNRLRSFQSQIQNMFEVSDNIFYWLPQEYLP